MKNDAKKDSEFRASFIREKFERDDEDFTEKEFIIEKIKEYEGNESAWLKNAVSGSQLALITTAARVGLGFVFRLFQQGQHLALKAIQYGFGAMTALAVGVIAASVVGKVKSKKEAKELKMRLLNISEKEKEPTF